MPRRGHERGHRRVGDRRVRSRPVEMAIDGLARMDGVGEDVDLLAAGHELRDVGRVALRLDAALDVMASEEAVEGDAEELAVETLGLRETEAAGLERVV